MSKDNENIPLPILTTEEEEPATEPFAANQMVRCEECLRANPPTRVNCIYCAAVLPANEATVNLQKPALRPLEKWEQGYNNIVLPRPANAAGELAETALREAADILRLRPSEVSLILSSELPLPVARAGTMDEASLVQRRLSNLGIETCIVSDTEPGADTTLPIKVRTIEIDDEGMYASQTPDALTMRILWGDLMLLVVGRLSVKRVEMTEQKRTRGDNRILDSSEFITDETVVDFYTRNESTPYRIASNSFDFSCLGESKGLLARENILTLVKFFRDHAPHVGYDDSFNSMRKPLELVWPSEQQVETSGWRRDRPGKLSLGTVTELTNEMQFLRYSRVRYHFQREKLSKTNDDA